jgi:hypothetical protein
MCNVIASGPDAQVTLSSATGNGAGVTVDQGATFGSHTLFLNLEAGTAPTHLQVRLEVSHDGVNWHIQDSGDFGIDTYLNRGLNAKVDARYVRGYVESHTGAFQASATIASS